MLIETKFWTHLLIAFLWGLNGTYVHMYNGGEEGEEGGKTNKDTI